MLNYDSELRIPRCLPLGVLPLSPGVSLKNGAERRRLATYPRCRDYWQGTGRPAQGRVKVAGKAALPSRVRGMRKAPGFPAQTASLFPLGSAGRLSLPAEPRGSVRADTSERRSLSASRVRGTAEPLWDVTFRGLWRDPARRRLAFDKALGCWYSCANAYVR
jgi:hypothetical protein